jgi:hypothetical protein
MRVGSVRVASLKRPASLLASLFELNPDGSLKTEPGLLDLTAHPLSNAFAASAIDAIKRCQPYTFLPADEYTNGWDKLEMTFAIGSPETEMKGSKSGRQYQYKFNGDAMIKQLQRERDTKRNEQ